MIKYFTELTTLQIISLIGIGLGIWGVFIFINYNFFGRSKAQDLDTGQILAYPDHAKSLVFGILETCIAGFILLYKLNDILNLNLSLLMMIGIYIIGFLILFFIIFIPMFTLAHKKSIKKHLVKQEEFEIVNKNALIIYGLIFALIIISLLIFTKKI